MLAKPNILILGAGPGGLSAAYGLLQGGQSATVLERDTVVGGLMRAVKFQDFEVDLGYKHLYSRIPQVHRLWSELLGSDYLPYVPRTGILYQGHLLERDRAFRGLRRGMPYGMLLSAFVDLLKHQLTFPRQPIRSLQDHTYARRGAKFTRIFSQGFDERFKGIPWSDLPAPQQAEGRSPIGKFMQDATKSLEMQPEWFHPAGGTGQIIEALEQSILRMGGEICLGQQVQRIAHDGSHIRSVTISKAGETTTLHPDIVVSSIPLQHLAPLMGLPLAPDPRELSFRRSVVMVYLFLPRPLTFPHTSIHVTCPRVAMSRITNYGALGGRMVPAGKACLCIEYFTEFADQLFPKSDHDITEFAVQECLKSGLIHDRKGVASLVIRSAQSDPATCWEDYANEPSRKAIYAQVSAMENLYQINRTGADKSTYAGLMAAQAILSQDKRTFERLTRADVNRPWEEGNA